MKWFGESWGAPLCEASEHTETPVGKFCPRCNKEIEADDQGVTMPFIGMQTHGEISYHLDCFLESIGIRS